MVLNCIQSHPNLQHKKPQKLGVELLPTKEELKLLGLFPICTKPRVSCVMEEYSVMWHLIKRLGIEVAE